MVSFDVLAHLQSEKNKKMFSFSGPDWCSQQSSRRSQPCLKNASETRDRFMTTSLGVSALSLLLSTQQYIRHLNKGAAGAGKGRAATCKWWQESCMFAPCAHVAVPGPGGECGASAVCLLVASCFIQSDKGNQPCGPRGHCFSCLTWSQQMIYLSLCVDFGTGIKNLIPSEHKLFLVYVGLNVIKTIKPACSANLTVHSTHFFVSR